MKTLAEIRQERKEAEQRKQEIQKRQVVLSLSQAGYIARVRLLRPIDTIIDVKKHEAFDAANPEMSIRAMCASMNGKMCHWCNAFKRYKNNDLRPRVMYVYPVWVHEVTDSNTGEENTDSAGFHLMVLNAHSTLNDTLMDYHTAGNVLSCDWRYSRLGSGKETKYILTPMPPTEFDTSDIPLPSDNEIIQLMIDAYPMKVVE